MAGWLGLPQGAFQWGASPMMATVQDVAPPAPSPFTWGAGGAMITPEQLARQRAIADDKSQADFSPVGSVWEGLGRVANNVFGGLENRKLNKAEASASEHSRSILEALRDPKTADPNAVVAALTDPYVSEGVRGLASKIYDRQNPKPVNNDTAADMALFEQQLGPGSGKGFLRNKLDPIVTIPTPFGPYVGRESGLAAALSAFQAGGGAATGATSAPPAQLPPDFDFGEGGPGAQAPRAGFR